MRGTMALFFGSDDVSSVLVWGGKDGNAVPEVNADDSHNWSSELLGYQISHFPSTYISDMSVPVAIDGNCGFDDILNDNFFSESQYDGQNLMLDMIEGFTELPALEETVEVRVFSDLLPPNETSIRKCITLVLDLDGKSVLSFGILSQCTVILYHDLCH
ncbi:hypothetical protein Dsin_000456 [Dipteronia sinensis]|uniref:Uncharacterized protein n=1 Tax=Dipteronia sinensis TaxID=43782 RepID=A0AAE0B3G8_9ROSI|nr:hypothetical protein Dsin_000456 [Dipteronia sinensis]